MRVDKMDMNAFVYVVLILIMLAFVSIPFNDVMDTTLNVSNSMTADAEVQSNNWMYNHIWHFTFLIIVIVIFIYIIRPTDNRDMNVQ